MEKEDFILEGMSCAACASHINKAVSQIEGVKEADVSLLTNSMLVAFASPADESKIIQAVKKAGYGCRPFKKGGSSSSLSGQKELFEDKQTPKMVSRLIASFVLLIPLFYISMGYMLNWPLGFLKDDPLTYGLILMVLSASIMTINYSYYSSGLKAFLHKASNMDTLVALGSLAAFIYSTVLFFQMEHYGSLGDMDRVKSISMSLSFETAGMVPSFITIGKTLESFSKGKTTSALKGLLDLAPKKASLIKDGKEEEVLAETLKTDDVLRVRPGESFPSDGEVLEGQSEADESALSGEAKPVEKKKGDKVYCATINQSGALLIRVTRVGEDMALSQIISTVRQASLTKTKASILADRVSGVFVPSIMLVALLVFICWILFGRNFIAGLNDPYVNLVSYSLERGIAVLVVACPCALGLATPVAIAVGSGKGARNGILFKKAETLEKAYEARYVVLDKTGTLTKGHMSVTDVLSKEEDMLSYAASLEALSEHPIGKAIRSKALKEGAYIWPCSAFEAESGYGAKGQIKGKTIAIGNYAYMNSLGLHDEEFAKESERLSKEGKTCVYVAKENGIIGLIAIGDELKADSIQAVSYLKALGLEVIMLTGDNKETAEAVGREAGVDKIISEVNPIDKQKVIKKLQQTGKVIMVGDGINDAPSLTQSDVGMAIKKGSDIAVDSADVVLMNSSLMDVYKAISLSRCTYKVIRENLFWAFFYNIIMIPIAAGALSFTGIYKLKPWYGSLAMSISSLTVVLNALRLNLIDIGKKRRGLRRRKKIIVPDFEPLSQKKECPIDNKEEEYEIKVEGMMCSRCVDRVRKAIQSVEGTNDISVSLKDKRASYKSASDKTKEVINAINKAGYEVK